MTSIASGAARILSIIFLRQRLPASQLAIANRVIAAEELEYLDVCKAIDRLHTAIYKLDNRKRELQKVLGL